MLITKTWILELVLFKRSIPEKKDDALIIAFWSLYEMLVLRNESGKDERKGKLWFTFFEGT